MVGRHRDKARGILTPVPDENPSGGNSQPRAYKWRYGPLRLVMPWLCVGVGILMTIRGALAVSSGDGDPLFLLLGTSLIVLGIIAFFVYRWMAKRGI